MIATSFVLESFNFLGRNSHVPLSCTEEEDTMDDWDQETLEKVIASKNAEYQQNKPTDIVCTIPKLLYTFFKHFSLYDVSLSTFILL